MTTARNGIEPRWGAVIPFPTTGAVDDGLLVTQARCKSLEVQPVCLNVLVEILQFPIEMGESWFI